LSVQVTFLGAGDAFNSGGRCHASYLISAPGTLALLDCGATALKALKGAGIAARDLDSILISHLHGDHFAGIPFIILDSIYDQPRQRPLTIVGPPNTESRVRELYRCLYRELSEYPLPFSLEFIEVMPDVRQKVGPIDLLPFRVPHQQKHVSLGYRVMLEGKTVVYSGDTGWTEDLVTQSQGADLFICECCYFETRTEYHLDYPRIAEHAHRFGSRRLVLTHIGREVLAHTNELQHELAHDGLVVEL
jgi:ribonuclease BN (tRNA processing enzyme)